MGRVLAVVLSVVGVLVLTFAVWFLFGIKLGLIGFFVFALLAGGVITLVFLVGSSNRRAALQQPQQQYGPPPRHPPYPPHQG